MFLKKPSVAWLVVGLGNPGREYERTRHNVGFRALDAAAELAGVKVLCARFHALTGQAVLGGQGVLLMKPTTYMNLSGQAVGEAARFYKLPPERVLVISDDVDLPLGRLRIRRGGSAGGHNGLKNVIEHLGADRFPRLRIGVGAKPDPDYDMVDWVLGTFHGEDEKTVAEACARAAKAAECLLAEGPDRAMSKYNQR